MNPSDQPAVTAGDRRRPPTARMRELTAIRGAGPLSRALVPDYGPFHLEADLRWIALTAARPDALRAGSLPGRRDVATSTVHKGARPMNDSLTILKPATCTSRSRRAPRRAAGPDPVAVSGEEVLREGATT